MPARRPLKPARLTRVLRCDRPAVIAIFSTCRILAPVPESGRGLRRCDAHPGSSSSTERLEVSGSSSLSADLYDRSATNRARENRAGRLHRRGRRRDCGAPRGGSVARRRRSPPQARRSRPGQSRGTAPAPDQPPAAARRAAAAAVAPGERHGSCGRPVGSCGSGTAFAATWTGA